MCRLENKVALVTGASGGIGRAVAQALADAGACIVLNYLHKEAPALSGPGHRTIRADVSSAEDVRRMFQAIESEYGRLDILVNNAGVNRDAKLGELTETMWDEVLATNLKGPFLCSKSAASLMSARDGGSIVNIASESALRGRSGACNYTAAKAGLVAMTKSLASELAPSIRVNCLALGLIDTEEVVARLGLHRPENLKARLEEIPLRRLGTPEEVAKVVLFMASEESSYITGQVLAVGGGRWM